MKRSIFFMIIMMALLCSSVLAVTWSPQGNMDLKNRYKMMNALWVYTKNLTISTPPVECPITNSWMSFFNGTHSICRTENYTLTSSQINYSLIPGKPTGLTNSTLYLCIDSSCTNKCNANFSNGILVSCS